MFPKQMTKYEKQYAELMKREKEREEQEAVETRKKILALVEMMQYDDDFEESKVTEMKLNQQQLKATTAPST